MYGVHVTVQASTRRSVLVAGEDCILVLVLNSQDPGVYPWGLVMSYEADSFRCNKCTDNDHNCLNL